MEYGKICQNIQEKPEDDEDDPQRCMLRAKAVDQTPIEEMMKLRENLIEYKKVLEVDLNNNYMTNVDLTEEKQVLADLNELIQQTETSLAEYGFKNINGDQVYAIQPKDMKKLTKEHQEKINKNITKEITVTFVLR